MTQPGQSDTVAIAQRIRNDWIDLTHVLPDPAPPKMLRLWNEADNAMRELVILLETA